MRPVFDDLPVVDDEDLVRRITGEHPGVFLRPPVQHGQQRPGYIRPLGRHRGQLTLELHLLPEQPLRPLPPARREPEINSTPLALPGTVASLSSLRGAHEIRVRSPRQVPR
jgi:hypothetical protein